MAKRKKANPLDRKFDNSIGRQLRVDIQKGILTKYEAQSKRNKLKKMYRSGEYELSEIRDLYKEFRSNIDELREKKLESWKTAKHQNALDFSYADYKKFQTFVENLPETKKNDVVRESFNKFTEYLEGQFYKGGSAEFDEKIGEFLSAVKSATKSKDLPEKRMTSLVSRYVGVKRTW